MVIGTHLIKSFANPNRIKQNAIERLIKLNLSPKSSEIYAYIAEYKAIRQCFDNLNISSSDVLRYYVWTSMPKQFQNQFVHIINSNNPTLEEIDFYFFEAAERYNSVRRSSGGDTRKAGDRNLGEASVMAVDINFKHKPKVCNICLFNKKTSSHPIFKCPVYISPKMKLEQLKLMKACFKCGFANQYSSDCKFNFRQLCTNCGGKHFNYLCGATNGAPRGSSVISNNIVTMDIESRFTENNYDIILPTFSCNITTTTMSKRWKFGQEARV